MKDKGEIIKVVRPEFLHDLKESKSTPLPEVEEEKPLRYSRGPDSIPTISKQPWPTSAKTSPGVAYSPEVIEHYGYLKQVNPSEAEIYLRRIKEKRMSDIIGGGVFETALKEATEKANYYSTQAAIMLGEAEKWNSIRTNLQNLVSLASTPAKAITTAPRRVKEERAPSVSHSYWPEQIKAILQANPIGLERVHLMRELNRLKPSSAATSIYNIIRSNEKAGRIGINSTNLLIWTGGE